MPFLSGWRKYLETNSLSDDRVGNLSFRERYLSLRSNKLKPADFQRVLFFSSLEVPFEVPFFFYESLT